MNNKNVKIEQYDLALHRFSIISPLITQTSQEKSNLIFFEKAAKHTYWFNGTSRQYSMYTIKTWYYNFQKSGFEGLINNDRNDSGNTKSLNQDAQQFIYDAILAKPKVHATVIFRKLIENNIISPKSVSLRTVQRYSSAIRKNIKIDKHKRNRFQCSEPCDVWQTDTSVGPFIKINGRSVRTYLIMFLDDASRYIVGYGFFFEDNEINMQNTFKAAIKQYGKPKILYADNGKTYCSRQLKIICAKLGIELKNTRPYDPESKGKIERCFRTIKQSWMRVESWEKFSSIDDIEKSFEIFLNDYHSTIHSTIQETPFNVFFSYENLRTVNSEMLDKSFMHEFIRKADKCGVVSYKNKKYEVPSQCIGRKCIFEFSPSDKSKIYYKGKECKLLDMYANSKANQKSKVSFSKYGEAK